MSLLGFGVFLRKLYIGVFLLASRNMKSQSLVVGILFFFFIIGLLPLIGAAPQHGGSQLPLITYYDAAFGNLKLVRCGLSDCMGENFVKTIMEQGNVGLFSDVAYHNGLPYISYFNTDKKTLNLISPCDDVCDNEKLYQNVVIDSVTKLTSYHSLVFHNGLPSLSYYDTLSGDLNYVACANPSCTLHYGLQTLDFIGNVGSSNSLAFGSDGLPIISYHDATNQQLKLVKCTTISCDSFFPPIVLDNLDSPGDYSTIGIGSDGLPVIGYEGGKELRLIHCDNVDCSSFDTTTVFSSSYNTGIFTSMVIGSDGYPFLTYKYGTPGAGWLGTAHCTDNLCSSVDQYSTLTPYVQSNLYSSITVGEDGNPLISLHVGGKLYVVHCEDVACSSFSFSLLDAGSVGYPNSITA
jgi:hypothetical protein